MGLSIDPSKFEALVMMLVGQVKEVENQERIILWPFMCVKKWRIFVGIFMMIFASFGTFFTFFGALKAPLCFHLSLSLSFFAFTPFYTSLYLNGIVLLVSFWIFLFPLVIQSFHAQNLSYIEYILLLLSFCCFLLFEWWNNVVDSLCSLSLQWFWRRMFLDDCC